MYYEINVTLHGHHFFATAPRSLTTLWELRHAYNTFVKKFPEEEGYGLSVRNFMTTGTAVEGFPAN